MDMFETRSFDPFSIMRSWAKRQIVARMVRTRMRRRWRRWRRYRCSKYPSSLSRGENLREEGEKGGGEKLEGVVVALVGDGTQREPNTGTGNSGGGMGGGRGLK